MGRLMAVAGIAGVLVVGALVTGASPASAQASAVPHAWRVHQFNLAGWKQNQGALAPANVVVDRVKAANPRPLVVTLNEVCSSRLLLSGQWERVVAELRPLGYSVVFAPSLTNVGLRCDRFGNGLAVAGSINSTSLLTYQAQWLGSAERRNIVCAQASTPLGAAAACSTHIVPKPEGPAQVAEALSFVESQYGKLARLVGGDFNLPTEHSALDGWYGGYHEGDPRLSKQPTMDSGLRADYGWADGNHFTAQHPATVIPVNESDHHWYEAGFTRTT